MAQEKSNDRSQNRSLKNETQSEFISTLVLLFLSCIYVRFISILTPFLCARTYTTL